MNTVRYRYVGYLTVFSALLISTLVASSFVFKQHDGIKNDFNRFFIRDSVLQFKTASDIKYNSYYIAGLTKDSIFLGNYSASNHALMLRGNSLDSQYLKLNLPEDKVSWKNLRFSVYYPDFYVFEGITPNIFSRQSKQHQYSKFSNKTPFDQCIPISPRSYVLRVYNERQKNRMLFKIGDDIIPHNEIALERQIDGFFCTDGMLLYNQQIDRLVYVYFYRNVLLSLDTSLNVVYKAHTIDTTTVSDIKTDVISSEHKTVVLDRNFVNMHAYTYGKFIFVHSVKIADNEVKGVHIANSAIDVYSVFDGSYLYSFYIPTYNGLKMYDFAVYNGMVIALYEHFIAVYSFVKGT